jgi:beta-glucosidase
LIGTNNLGVERSTGLPRNSTTEAVEGITEVVRTLRDKLPDANILLLGVLPRGAADSAVRAQVVEANKKLARLHDGSRIHFLDIGPSFLSPEGSLSRSLMPDLLHLSEAGYAVWAAAIKEPLAKLLEPQPSR